MREQASEEETLGENEQRQARLHALTDLTLMLSRSPPSRQVDSQSHITFCGAGEERHSENQKHQARVGRNKGGNGGGRQGGWGQDSGERERRLMRIQNKITALSKNESLFTFFTSPALNGTRGLGEDHLAALNCFHDPALRAGQRTCSWNNKKTGQIASAECCRFLSRSRLSDLFSGLPCCLCRRARVVGLSPVHLLHRVVVVD